MKQLTVKQFSMIVSRELRKNMTVAEKLFWTKVRNKQFHGYKFHRQYPVFYKYYDKEKFFIADFYCHVLKLVVEIDGGIHLQQKEYDKKRSEILQIQKALKVIRFSNEEVIENMNRILIKLKQFI